MLKKILYFFLLLFLGAASGFVTYKVILINKKVAVPELKGQTPEAARGMLRDLGLRLQVTGKGFDPIIAPGGIISQEPEAGRQSRIDSTVRVIISEGPETARMPSVLGQKIPDALELLNKDGLGVTKTIHVQSDTAPAGAIIAQDPEPGEKTGPVTIVASDGPPHVSYYCPDFRLMSVEEVRTLCQALGLEPVFGNSGPPASLVASQKPEAGSEITEGQKVFLELK
ncbi:MAG: PASTA domain-containing protein [Nitrospiraceae bacterium]|nr:PASTA domain-containing protein [Nitrospiraceae bacterium]